MSWDSLRVESRQLENDIDGKLQAFSKLGRDVGRSGGGGYSGSSGREPLLGETNSGMFETMTVELQQLLIKLSAVNDQMQEAIGDNPTASISHTLGRHTSLLNEMQHEFTKTKHSIRQTRDKADLLSSVQRDINTYQNEQQRRQEQQDKISMSTQNSMRAANDTISIAMAAKDALVQQRSMLSKVQTKMTNIAEKVPMLNNIMHKMKVAKQKDKMIIAGVIALCIVFLLWYIFG